MRINREKILGLLNELKKRGEEERGMQPLMSLGCFYDLKRDNDEHCKKCPDYETCRLYLKSFAKEENPFIRED
jgi:hypothetical protein